VRLRGPAWPVLGGLIVVSVAVRSWAALRVPVPWIAPDEMLYGLLGQGLFRAGHLSVLGGPTPYYSLLVPLVVGLPLSLGDLTLGYTLYKLVAATLMSLAAVPVYLWGRSLVSSRLALLAAALTLAVPGLAYAGLVMSEVVFYPVFLLAAWAIAAALVRPTAGRQILLVVAVLAAAATRVQAVVLVPILVGALLVDALLARSRRSAIRLAPALGAIVVLAVAWASWRVAAGRPLLGAYDSVRQGGGSGIAAGTALRFVGYHAGDALLFTGVFPVCALLVLLVVGLARGERSAPARAYVAVAASTLVCLVVEVGVFASQNVGQLAERDVLPLAPVLFLGFALWLERGAPRPRALTIAVVLVAAAFLLLLPVQKLVTQAALPDALSLDPLYRLRAATSAHTLELVFTLGAAGAFALFALVPRRLVLVLPVLLLLLLGGASIAASIRVADAAHAQQSLLLGPNRRWVDAAARAPVAYLYDGSGYWNGVWETLFWNRSVHRVYRLGDAPRVPGALPQTSVRALADGRLVLPGGVAAPAADIVAPSDVVVAGRPLAQVSLVGNDRAGLTLWAAEQPLRVTRTTHGFQPNGDVYAGETGIVTVYACRNEMLRLTFFVKQPETVRISEGGRALRVLTFGFAQAWNGAIPLRPPGSGTQGACAVEIAPSGLLGTSIAVAGG
jgi:hypothetical protein